MSETDSDLQKYLPKTLETVCSVIGFANTMKIVAGYSGSSVFVPKILKQNHRLVALIGEEASQLMSGRFGGSLIQIARAVKILAVIRDRSIVRRYDRGSKVSVIARDAGITERHVYTVLGRCVSLGRRRSEARRHL
jgi:Mor family transcriptional regulator